MEFRDILLAFENKATPPWNTALGGQIFIHAGGAHKDWTVGCVALYNSDMDELFQITSVGPRLDSAIRVACFARLAASRSNPAKINVKSPPIIWRIIQTLPLQRRWVHSRPWKGGFPPWREITEDGLCRYFSMIILIKAILQPDEAKANIC